jgi:long-subunit fatty acid transport protein
VAFFDDAARTPTLAVESADISRSIFSQSATWMPVERAYLQGSLSCVSAKTDTPANGQAPNKITDSDNDYLTLSLAAGYALDDKTDITAAYSYYYCDNYNRLAAPMIGSVGYGTSIEEHVFSLSLNRQITPSMLWNVGYGYYTGEDDAVPGFNDFSAHVFSTGLQIRF